eukprot:CAMPEP_0184288542 /NCGR_PEP_ID=MMETSP1049-20130417/1069_1 /TAXON_ID=77928 /ORGANISM="Proteomonas sulcata, Strain CCMP704" /LENGTH=87 /DNA_ID=CAMNT_0026595009 /DNA_START=766 /DNA_END=1029 /DNA_ORIENTATION=+
MHSVAAPGPTEESVSRNSLTNSAHSSWLIFPLRTSGTGSRVASFLNLLAPRPLDLWHRNQIPGLLPTTARVCVSLQSLELGLPMHMS